MQEERAWILLLKHSLYLSWFKTSIREVLNMIMGLLIKSSVLRKGYGAQGDRVIMGGFCY